MADKIGFTGTQHGMTIIQRVGADKMLRILQKKGYNEFHHGDCIGADEQAHEMAHRIGLRIVMHPPIKPDKRAFCDNADEIRKEKEYLDRNKDIVDETDILIATPKESEEQLRSGTWSTIRYAKKNKKPIIMIYPDGLFKIIKEK